MADEEAGATFRDLSEPAADADVGIRFGFGLALPLEDREWACWELRKNFRKNAIYSSLGQTNPIALVEKIPNMKRI